MADDVEQDRRGTNLIIKGLLKTDNPKETIAQILSTKLDTDISKDDIKYTVIINNRQATKQDTESYKICFFDRKKRDIIYSKRMQLKQTNIYISEDLTMARSKLAYDSRVYCKTMKGSSTWTIDGKVYLKDDIDARPRAIYNADDLKPNKSSL